MPNSPESRVDGAGEEFLARARSLLQTYSEAAERALAALGAADLDGVDAALEERQHILPILDPLFAQIRDATPASLPAKDAEALRTLALAAEALDTKLKISLASEKQRISHEVDLLDNEEAVRSAYGQTSPTEGRRIDLVR
jgi:hypothetical protein